MISRSRLTSTRVSQRGQCRGFSVSQRFRFLSESLLLSFLEKMHYNSIVQEFSNESIIQFHGNKSQIGNKKVIGI